MKFENRQKIAAIFVGIIVILMVTNPGIDEFSDFAGLEKIDDIHLVTKRENNYFIFSTYTQQFSDNRSSIKETYLGILGSFSFVGKEIVKGSGKSEESKISPVHGGTMIRRRL